MEVFAFEPQGLRGALVKVEVDIRRGIPGVDMVGLAAASVRESRERVRVALRNAGFEFPKDRVLINLSPSDLPKQGSLYDLPVALKILDASSSLPLAPVKVLVMGELALDGSVNRIRGTLPAILEAQRFGIDRFILPAGNRGEYRMLGNSGISTISHARELLDICACLARGRSFHSSLEPKDGFGGAEEVETARQGSAAADYSDYYGNDAVIRALSVAAAGRHNIMLLGAPGAGKTMAALRFPSILPELKPADALEVAAIWSMRGYTFLMRSNKAAPPFRTPHHSASEEGMIGGGRIPLPGEISLAHKGVLFLDETSEFRRDVLQSLREPMESGSVTIVRAGRLIRFPADFQLILAANACPCGFTGREGGYCTCSPKEIGQYWKKIGGPLLDRVDIRLLLEPPRMSSLIKRQGADSGGLRRSVEAAASRQMERTKSFGGVFNGRLDPDALVGFCKFAPGVKEFLYSRMDELGLSARAGHSVLKLALTISDLDGEETLTENAVEEALAYRSYGEGGNYASP